MAWEEESIESGADFEEVGGKKNKLKIIIIAVVVLALAGAGFAFKDKILGGDDPTEQATDGDKKAEGKGDDAVAAGDDEEEEDDGEEQASGFRVNLQKFTINLSGGSTPHFLVTTIVLEVSTQEMKDMMDDPADPSLAMIKTRDVINRLLMSQDYNDIKNGGVDATDDIALAIKTRLNKRLKHTGGKVLNVYFSEFLID